MLTSQARQRWLPRAALALVVILTALAYWPGTRGTFLLDDYPNLLENPAMQHLQPTPGSLLNASFSSDSGPTHRPLAMASFALNILADGGAGNLRYTAPAMKWTNVAIHLLNGLLVFFLLTLLLRQYRRLRPEVPESTCIWTAVIVTSAWLLAPINLTSVLYVIQRMTSLAATFTLLGLVAYTAGRSLLYEGRSLGKAWLLLITAAMICTPLAIFTKEDGALTIVYAGVIEWALFRLRTAEGSFQRSIAVYFSIFLVVPAILGLAWLIPVSIHSPEWQIRNFNLVERILTEGRVIWHYLWWSLVPNINAMTLYHDAFPVSQGLFKPWTTLLAWIGIAGLLAVVLASRRRYPLLSLGVLWFLAGQVLTATFMPLELVFEHREYLPSLGLLVAVFGTIMILVGNRPYRRIAAVSIVAIIALYGAGLTLRSMNWGNPLTQLSMAVRNHPDSPRAAYNYASLLAIVSDVEPKLAPKAFIALRKAASIPSQTIAPEATEIILANQTGQPVKTAWYKQMARRLEERNANPGDISALSSLVHCAVRDKNPCRLSRSSMQSVFSAALERNPDNTQIAAIYGNYLLNVAHEPKLARQVFHALVKLHPSSPELHFDLGVAEVFCGNLENAVEQLAVLRRLNHFGTSNQHIQSLSNLIAQAKEAESAHGET